MTFPQTFLEQIVNGWPTTWKRASKAEQVATETGLYSSGEEFLTKQKPCSVESRSFKLFLS